MVARRTTYDEFIRDYAALRDLEPWLVGLGGTGARRDASLQRLGTRGAIVSAFSLAESYIRTGFRRSLYQIAVPGRSASDLPSFLQDAVVTGALPGLGFQIRISQPTVRRGLLIDEIQRLGTIAGGPVTFPLYFAGHDSPNLDDQSISRMLKSLGVSKPWECLTVVASGAGFGVASLKSDLSDAVRLRNLAAHDAGWFATVAHLQQLTRTMSALSMAFETVLGLAVDRLRADGPIRALQPTKLDQPHPVGIQKHLGAWRQLGANGIPGTVLASNYRDARTAAMALAGYSGVARVDPDWGVIGWR